LTEGERARTFESSKKLVEQAETAKERIAQDLRNSSKPGPKTEGPSRREVARAMDVPEATLRVAEQHVEAVEHWPFMREKEWRQSHVLAVKESLEKLPEPERARRFESSKKVVEQAKKAAEVSSHSGSKPQPSEKGGRFRLTLRLNLCCCASGRAGRVSANCPSRGNPASWSGHLAAAIRQFLDPALQLEPQRQWRKTVLATLAREAAFLLFGCHEDLRVNVTPPATGNRMIMPLSYLFCAENILN
jgi:hypothetical protein